MKPADAARRLARELQAEGMPRDQARLIAGRRIAEQNGRFKSLEPD